MIMMVMTMARRRGRNSAARLGANDGDQGVGAHLGFSVVFLELRRSGGVTRRSDEAELRRSCGISK